MHILSAPQDGHFFYTSEAHFETIVDYVRVLINLSHLIMQNGVWHSANTLVSAAL
jgi:hypothetical protein